MKRLVWLFAAMLCCLSALAAGDELPRDPLLRTGRLSNGMTYYIRHNDKPAGLADFYIVHNVGAVQEDSTQNGLAHFLEHMAFNGTESFEGRSMIDWLQSIGVAFGRDLNAYTSQEQTVYNINNVPVKRKTVIDSVLLILHDWSHYISLLPEEIDAERGVILEERRTGLDAGRRMFNKMMPLLFNGTKYAEHDVIGPESVLKSFTPEHIRDFYRKWYRPDLQAVVMVGDFDAEEMERLVRERFSHIPMPEDAPVKQAVVIPPYDKDEVLVVSDPELTRSSVEVYCPTEIDFTAINNTREGELKRLMAEVVNRAVSDRVRELIMEGAPVLSSYAGLTSRMRSETLSAIAVTAPTGRLAEALGIVTREVERVRRYGLSQSSVKTAVADMIKSAQMGYNNRKDLKNPWFVQRYISNFLDGSPAMGPEDDYHITVELLESITPEMVAGFIPQMFPDAHAAVIASVPERDVAAVDAVAILEAYREGRTGHLEPPADEASERELIEVPIEGGRIVSRSADVMGDEVLTLSNGVRVVMRQTDFKDDEVLMEAWAPGGLFFTGDELLASAHLFSQVVGQSGVGDMSAIELDRLLAGKMAQVDLDMGNDRVGLRGRSSVTDLKEMMELIWLRFNAPRFDSVSFKVVMKKVRNLAENYRLSPAGAFRDTVSDVRYGHNGRVYSSGMLFDRLDSVSLDDIRRLYARFYGDASRFTFFFAGNLGNKEQFEALVAKYLGSLNVGNGSLGKPVVARYDRTDVVNRFERVQESPKSRVQIEFVGEGIAHSVVNKLQMAALAEVINLRCTEEIRERMGAVYGVGVAGAVSAPPSKGHLLIVAYDTNGEQLDSTVITVKRIFDALAEEGPTPEEVVKVKEAMVKNYNNSLKDNGTWLSYLKSVDMYGRRFTPEATLEAINGISAESIRKFAAKVRKKSGVHEVVMEP